MQVASIDSHVRQVMSAIPRERFIPDDVRGYADADEPLPIGFGQTISQPTVVAIMTTALELTGRERVLEIGTGSGFQTAVLAELAAEVYTIEIVEALGRSARTVLEDLGYHNIHYRIGDGYEGWPERAPFDRIICTAAPPSLPSNLVDQLALGGILVAPVGSYVQELLRVVRREHGLEEEELGGVRFVPMVRAPDKR